MNGPSDPFLAAYKFIFVFVLLFLPSFLFCYTKFGWSLAFPVQKLPPVSAGFAKNTPLLPLPG